MAATCWHWRFSPEVSYWQASFFRPKSAAIKCWKTPVLMELVAVVT
jgi:hypothetical protein